MIAGGFAAVLLLCVACRARPLSVPASFGAPPGAALDAPSGAPSDTVCLAAHLGSGGSVATDPTGVQAAWLPGMDAHDCRAVLVRGTAAQARRLAHDIDHLPPYPQGPIDCPADDGAAVALVFGYAGHRYEQVVVDLAGCAGVAGGGQETDALRADLRPLAPPAWRTYVSG